MSRETKGAEAEVRFSEGKVEKRRPRKGYRHRELDERLREERTEKEKRIMKAARKNGVNVPEVRQVDEKTLEMEEVEGKELREVLDTGRENMEKAGENIGKLHSAEIIHGDLTTRNLIVEGDEVFLIDFGLSERSGKTEDRAVDIHLLKQVLETSHVEVAEEAWKKFLEGYRRFEESGEVLERLEEVEKRGRYK